MEVPSLTVPVAPAASSLPLATSESSSAPSAAKAPVQEPPAHVAGFACIDAVRDARPPSGRGRRPLALVKVEYEQLGRLEAATAPTSPDRTALAFRLAEAARELADLDPSSADGYLMDAMAHYRVAAKGQGPSADEATYALALGAECDGNLAEERRLLFSIVQRNPTSRLAAYVYYGFGELFLKDAAHDPSKLPLAEQSYREAQKFPGPIAAAAKSKLASISARLASP